MATFLALAKAALRDSGLGSPDALTDVATASNLGVAERESVEFVRESWLEIQSDQENWRWMQESFRIVLAAGKERYTPNPGSLDPTAPGYEAPDLVDEDSAPAMPQGFRSWFTQSIWYITDQENRTVVGGEFAQLVGGYQEWRTLTFNRRLPNQRPQGYAIAPNLDLLVVPTPNKPFVIDGEFQRGVQTFSENADIPRGLPSDYHNLIKWKAIGMLHGFDEAVDSVRFASEHYAIHFNNLKRLYLPAIELAPALGADDYETYERSTFFGRGFIG